MLVLTRRLNERILVDDVEITVVDIRGDKVRIGINAPRSKHIDRADPKSETQPKTLRAPAARRRAAIPQEQL